MTSVAPNASQAQSSTPQQQPTPPTSGSATPQTAPSAAAAGRSYAGAATSVDSRTNPTSHSKSASIAPALPSLGGPTIANGNASVGPATGVHHHHHHSHSRKPSVTISAAGNSGQMPNGGPTVGQTPAGNGIQFGSVNHPQTSTANMAASHDGSAPAHPNSENPRANTPAKSPSPIPQPAVESGGRPPQSSLHQSTGSLSFGAFPNNDDAQRRSSVPGPMTPNMPNAHLRRDSNHSQHDHSMGPGGRGGYPSGGRGRGFNPGFNQQIPHSPSAAYRNLPPNGPRGPGGPNMPPYGSRGGAYGAPYSPSGRSPALAHAQPVPPHQNQVPMQSPGMSPGYGYSPGYGPPNGYHDPNQAGYYGQPYNVPGQMPSMYMGPPNGYMQGQNSPRPHYQTPSSGYGPSQYGQPQPMSRQGSHVSDRPASTLSQPSQPPMTPSSHQHSQSRGTGSPGPKFPAAQQKKSSAIKITNPNTGETVNFEKGPATPSTATSAAAGSSTSGAKGVESAQTPPPGTPGTQHVRSESKAQKSQEEVRNDLRDQIQAKIKADQEAAAQKQRDEDDQKKQKEEQEAEASRKAKEEENEAAKRAAQEAEEAKLAAERALEAEKQKAEQEAAAQKKIDDEKARVAAAAAAAEQKPAATAEKAQPAFNTVKADEDELPPKPEMPDVNASDEDWDKYDRLSEAYEAAVEARFQKKKAAQNKVKAAKDAEIAAKQDEELRKQEAEAARLEEEKEKKRAEGDANADLDAFAALKKGGNAFRATETATEALPEHGSAPDSGANTPKSDAATMPPPTLRAGQKPKPAALKLETQKQVEAAQPSAALQSLLSARRLTHFDSGVYPSGIQSPNPALNTSAKGSFRYDKDFLLQFQKVFTEKPSENWQEKLKETVGDTNDPPGSARGSRASMGGRTPSARGGIPGPFAPGGGGMGQFSGGSRTLPPGTTSQERFAASAKGTANPTIRWNPDNKGGFPGSFPMPTSRQPSNQLASPRAGPGERGSRRGNNSKAGKRNDTADAKSMPLTAGMDIKPIEVSAGGWKPTSLTTRGAAGPPPGGENGYLAPDVVQRKVKAALNKMTPTTFEKIAGQILEIVMQSKKETDGRTLRQVIQLTFEKATDEAHWAEMYAQFCGKMLSSMTADIRDETLPKDKNGQVINGSTLFRKYLLNRCQQDFEQGWQSKLPEKPDGGEAALLSDEYYAAAAAKRRGLGLVRFIGELFKLGMLTARIMHMCVQKLVDFDGIPDEAEIESLTSLLKTIGADLDEDEKGHVAMNIYFSKIDDMMKVKELQSRLKFMLMDIVDLRKAGWKGKNIGLKGPKTIEEVRMEALEAQRAQEAKAAQEQQNRRGGGAGGRPGVGRGDARNFSNPPPDFSNRVGMDDLRRLGRGSSRTTGNQGPMGPTSMFNTRGSNKRISTPGGVFGRSGGEDSGPTSRTATPPIKSDKERREEQEKAAAGANAFSALAALESAESNDMAGSPATSPPTVKRALAGEALQPEGA